MRVALLALLALPVVAQRDGWTKPFPAYTIAGNLHYVGTEDLACFLITTPQGHILINTGVDGSVPMIRESMSKLGFKMEDIKILLTMQAHYDHTAGLAGIAKISGAKMYATAADAPILEDGGFSDPAFGGKRSFEPISVARKLKDGDLIKLGGTTLKTILMPGHTKGSVGYSLDVAAAGKKEPILIVNLPSVVMPLVGNKGYPNIVADYRHTFEMLKKLHPGIWVAGHGSQYDMAAKHKAGSFVDPEGYAKAVARMEQLFEERLARESGR
ncbi:MAG: subclass B3 metallo-beta-lactamase [Bryobacteraceae bacterium]